jgi:hypothetical protein
VHTVGDSAALSAADQIEECNMKTRFIQSAVQRAQQSKAELPFARGTRRAAAIARRKQAAPLRKSA